MFMNIVCPACGHKWRVPERMFGQQVQCPACMRSFPCGTSSAPSLKARPAAAKAGEVKETPSSRAAEVQAEPAIHYRCARCHKPLESPAHLAGHKLNCPECGQRLQIPQASTAPPPSDNKTILAVEQTPPAVTVPVSVVQTEEPVLTVLPASPAVPAAPVRREYCLECGVEVTRRLRVQTCPDCGSLFCSARCYRDHVYHAHPTRRG
jgi:DNA-directed RNA polymerase subunit RPC12/RpoP